MGFASFLKRFIVNVTILVLFITFMPGLLPDVSITKSYKTERVALTGKLTPNNKLSKIEYLFKDDLLGPESLADDKNYLYTTLQTGDIVKVSGKHIVPVVKFGKPCKGLYEEQICGRPLGIRFGGDGYLYAADAYYGLFKVDVNTGEKTKLVAAGQEIDGKTVKIPNSVAVSCNGDIYWTDSSSNFLLQDGIFTFLDDPSGRLIHYNAKTGKNKVLVDGILFANGVALSKNEDFVIVSDAKNQLLRHYLKGPKTGTTETLLTLPGIPDNIQTDGKSGFLVSVLESNAENPVLINSLSQFPNVRRFLARSLGLAELGFRFVDKLSPNEICQKTLHFIGHFTSAVNLLPTIRTVVIHISENGEILDSLWTDNATIKPFSEAHIVKNYLYLGSPFNDFIGRIPLSEIGWDHLSSKSDSASSKKQLCAALTGEAKPATPKPTTTTQKPTTTTQKPTTTTQKPTTTTQKPTTTTQKPTTTVPKQSTVTQKVPKSPKPATTQKTAPSAQKPATQNSATANQRAPPPTNPKPVTSTQKLSATTQKSVPETQKPPPTATPKPQATPKAAAATEKPPTTQKPVTTSKPQTKPQNPTQTPPSPKPVAAKQAEKEKISNTDQKKNVEGKKSATKTQKNEL